MVSRKDDLYRLSTFGTSVKLICRGEVEYAVCIYVNQFIMISIKELISEEQDPRVIEKILPKVSEFCTANEDIK